MNILQNDKEIQIEFQLKSIEILDVNIAFPGPAIKKNKTYHYNINLQHRINPENNLVFVDTSVETMEQEKKTRLGFIKVSCIYFVEHLAGFKSEKNKGQIELPQQFAITLNSISVSTTRGIMYSQFRGTFLHNAILPIVDPKGIPPEKQQN